MNKELKQFKEELQTIAQRANQFEQERQKLLVRLAELNGIIKYLEGKEKSTEADERS